MGKKILCKLRVDLLVLLIWYSFSFKRLYLRPQSLYTGRHWHDGQFMTVTSASNILECQ
jgi:hypothetical protein